MALVTSQEAISYLGLDRQGLRQPREALRWLCRTGKLRFTKVGRAICFRQEWLDELIDNYAMQHSTLATQVKGDRKLRR